MLLLLCLRGCESEEGTLLSIMGWESLRNLITAECLHLPSWTWAPVLLADVSG